jgi:hypothetical protein
MTKKSKSTEELKPKLDQEAQELTSQLNATQEKLNNSRLALKAAEEQKENTAEALNNLQIRLQGHEPSLLLKARQDLIAIRQQLLQLFPDSPDKPSELLSQLISQQKELIDHNNELRLKSLKDSDALKASQKNEDQYFSQYQQDQKQISQLQIQLTKTHQDLKQAQRIIELKLPENQEQTNPQPNY